MSTPKLSREPLSGREWFAVELEPTTGHVWMLDQRRLPTTVVYYELKNADAVAESIKNMTVRGAPAIGIAAAYAMYQVAREQAGDPALFLMAIGVAGRALNATRPTAVNLAWAISRMSRVAAEVAAEPADVRAERMREEAEKIHIEDRMACESMGELGAKDIPDGATILTHCNAGALATGGTGTALGVIRAAHQAGKNIRVLADETRPYLQGARLTAWELHRDGIDVEVITDSMAGHFMRVGAVDFVVVGSDRIAKNGDVANKIGTYSIAVLAQHHAIPFTVAAPWSTVDLRAASGAEIPIEERSAQEVSRIGSEVLVGEGIRCRHPAFDITPAQLVNRVYTERGSFRPMKGEGPESLLKKVTSNG